MRHEWKVGDMTLTMEYDPSTFTLIEGHKITATMPALGKSMEVGGLTASEAAPWRPVPGQVYHVETLLAFKELRRLAVEENERLRALAHHVRALVDDPPLHSDGWCDSLEVALHRAGQPTTS